jgi:hypothetical protein
MILYKTRHTATDSMLDLQHNTVFVRQFPRILSKAKIDAPRFLP